MGRKRVPTSAWYRNEVGSFPVEQLLAWGGPLVGSDNDLLIYAAFLGSLVLRNVYNLLAIFGLCHCAPPDS
jgi:hypothetical protein